MLRINDNLKNSKLIACCICCCWGMHNCGKYKQIAWVSPETHRHCCVVVGPELGSQHEGSVPWSSPWGASTCLAPRNVCTPPLDRSAAAPAFLFLQSPTGLFCLMSFLLLCVSLLYAFQFSPSPVPPSRNLLKTFPPSRSWTHSPLRLLTLPPWLTAQVSIHWKMPTIPGRRTSYVFNLMSMLWYVVQCVHPIMYIQCNVWYVVQWVSREQGHVWSQHSDASQTLKKI